MLGVCSPLHTDWLVLPRPQRSAARHGLAAHPVARRWRAWRGQPVAMRQGRLWPVAKHPPQRAQPPDPHGVRAGHRGGLRGCPHRQLETGQLLVWPDAGGLRQCWLNSVLFSCCCSVSQLNTLGAAQYVQMQIWQMHSTGWPIMVGSVMDLLISEDSPRPVIIYDEQIMLNTDSP